MGTKPSQLYHGGWPRGGGFASAGVDAAARQRTVYLVPSQFSALLPSGDNPPRIVTLVTTVQAMAWEALEFPKAAWGGAWAWAHTALPANYDGQGVYARVYVTMASAVDSGKAIALLSGSWAVAAGESIDATGGAAANYALVAPAAAFTLLSDEQLLVPGGTPASNELLAIHLYHGADTTTVPIYVLGVRLRFGVV